MEVRIGSYRSDIPHGNNSSSKTSEVGDVPDVAQAEQDHTGKGLVFKEGMH